MSAVEENVPEVETEGGFGSGLRDQLLRKRRRIQSSPAPPLKSVEDAPAESGAGPPSAPSLERPDPDAYPAPPETPAVATSAPPAPPAREAGESDERQLAELRRRAGELEALQRLGAELHRRSEELADRERRLAELVAELELREQEATTRSEGLEALVKEMASREKDLVHAVQERDSTIARLQQALDAQRRDLEQNGLRRSTELLATHERLQEIAEVLDEEIGRIARQQEEAEASARSKKEEAASLARELEEREAELQQREATLVDELAARLSDRDLAQSAPLVTVLETVPETPPTSDISLGGIDVGYRLSTIEQRMRELEERTGQLAQREAEFEALVKRTQPR